MIRSITKKKKNYKNHFKTLVGKQNNDQQVKFLFSSLK